MVGQDPARFRRSTTATRFPCEASDQAKNLALPLPSTTTSYSSGCDTFFPLRVNSLRSFSCLGGDDFDHDQKLGPHEPGNDTEHKNGPRGAEVTLTGRPRRCSASTTRPPTPPTRPAAPVTRM